MNDFLHYDDVITGFSSRNEASLKGVHKIVQKGLESENKDFGSGFEECVAKPNRSKLSH